MTVSLCVSCSSGSAAVLQRDDRIRPETEAEEWASAGTHRERRGGGERKARDTHRHERDWFLSPEINCCIESIKTSHVHQSNWYKLIMTSKCPVLVAWDYFIAWHFLLHCINLFFTLFICEQVFNVVVILCAISLSLLSIFIEFIVGLDVIFDVWYLYL